MSDISNPKDRYSVETDLKRVDLDDLRIPNDFNGVDTVVIDQCFIDQQPQLFDTHTSIPHGLAVTGATNAGDAAICIDINTNNDMEFNKVIAAVDKIIENPGKIKQVNFSLQSRPVISGFKEINRYIKQLRMEFSITGGPSTQVAALKELQNITFRSQISH